MLVKINSNLYVISLVIIFLLSCSSFSGPESYPEWEEWQDLPESLSLEIDVREEVTTNDTLNFRIILSNTSNDTLRVKGGLSFSKQLEFDLAVVNKDGKLVWSRFPRESVGTSILYTITLKPGESYSINDIWDLKDENQNLVSPGYYTLYAGIHSLEIATIKKKEDGSTQETNISNFGGHPAGSQAFPLTIVSAD